MKIPLKFNNLPFTSKILFSFTLAVIVPLTVTIFSIGFYLQNNALAEMEDVVRNEVSDNIAGIKKSTEIFFRIESVASGNTDLKNFIYYANESNPQNVLDNMINQTALFERILFLIPEVNGIRFYVANPVIPERWPIFFYETRLGEKQKDTLLFNYKADFLLNLSITKEDSVSFLKELNLNGRHLGYLQVTMEMSDFLPFLQVAPGEEQYSFFAYKNEFIGTDRNKNVVQILSPDAQQEVLERINEETDSDEGKIILYEGASKRVVLWERYSFLDMIVFEVCPLEAIVATTMYFTLGTITLVLICSFLMFFVVKYITSRMFGRLNPILNGMREVREGNLDISIGVEGTDEVAETADSFNKMVLQLKELIAKITYEQKLTATTEIKAMQNQINAHFLYNVLETIKMQAELAEEASIVDSITLLGKMMRYCLRWRIPRVTLKEEIEYIQSYITLLNIRNDYVIMLSVQIDSPFYNTEIPKMLLQPVIENAFFHGIEQRGEDSLIEVFAFPENEDKQLKIGIRDYGLGMNTEQVEELIKSLKDTTESEKKTPGHIGLKNIQERLHVFYGTEYNIQIESELGIGTTIIIPIPLKTEKITLS